MSEQTRKYHFLLGGRDLEMLEIKKILQEHQHRFSDLQLEWGAKLSSYSHLFILSDHFVGIELQEDVCRPQYYTPIDHHNINKTKPASIEQVADLLKIKLNRFQLLVAANDKGYIPAMKAFGATKEEIAQIRMLDRRAQGVSEHDEELAKITARDHASMQGKTIVVESKIQKFSPIVDLFYPQKNLLIFNEFELVYYGEASEMLAGHFADWVRQGKAFYGGDINGFFGISKDVFLPDEISEIKNAILELLNN